MNVIFRADASLQMGSGHLMRCLTLAETLRERGVETSFICREHVGNLIALLSQKAMRVKILPAPATQQPAHVGDYVDWLGVKPAEDAAQTISAMDGARPDWLVVDHYALDNHWEGRLRAHVGRIMVIDDLACRHHDCDILLDQNYSQKGDERYAGLVAPSCRLFLGPRYALLRKEFRALRERLGPRRHDLKRIMVFFTSGEDQGATLRAMQGIELFGKAEYVDVVVGRENRSGAEIAKKCHERHWGFHCQVEYMPRLIAQADLVIGAGGSSNWERCALGVPAIVAVLADNQSPIAKALDGAGTVYNLGWCRDLHAADYAKALNRMSRERLADMSEKSLALVDSRGAERMADVLMTAWSSAADQLTQTS